MPNIPDPLRVVSGQERRYQTVSDGGASHIARGVQDIANTLGQVNDQRTQVAIAKIERDRRVNTTVQKLQVKTEYKRQVRDMLAEYEKDAAFVDRPVEEVQQEWMERTTKLRDELVQAVTFTDEEDVAKLAAKLEAVSTEGESALLNLHSTQTMERANNYWIETGNQIANSLADDPTPANLFAAIEDIKDVGGEFVEAQGEAKVQAATRSQVAGFIKTSVASLVDKGRFGEARALLKGQWVDPGTGKRTDFSGMIGADERMRLMGAIDAGENFAHEQASKARVEAVSRAVMSASTPEEFAQADAMLQESFASGDMTATRFNTEIGRLEKRQKGVLGNQIALARVGGAITGALPPLDPGNTDDRNAVDLYTRQRLSEMAEGETVSDVISAIVDETHVVPPLVTSSVRAALSGGNDEQVMEAVKIVRGLELKGKLEQAGIKKADIALATVAGELIEAGLPVKDAVDRARQQTDFSNKANMEVRQRDLTKMRKDYADWLSGHNWLSWELDPDINTNAAARLESDFGALYEDWYLRIGDEDLAKKRAFADLQYKWGTTEIDGGKRLMAHPPESRYAVFGDRELDAEWQWEQLSGELQNRFLWAEDEFEQDRVRLQFVAGSEDKPLYHILYERDGVWEAIVDPASPDRLLRWAPDWSSSAAHARLKKEMDEDIEATMQRARDFRANGPQMPDGIGQANQIMTNQILQKDRWPDAPAQGEDQ